MASKALLQSCAGKKPMWQRKLFEYLRGLEPEERAKVGMELLEVTRQVLAEIEQNVPSLRPSLRCPEFCDECPFLKICDR